MSVEMYPPSIRVVLATPEGRAGDVGKTMFVPIAAPVQEMGLLIYRYIYSLSVQEIGLLIYR
jgi:hypothetical protein